VSSLQYDHTAIKKIIQALVLFTGLTAMRAGNRYGKTISMNCRKVPAGSPVTDSLFPLTSQLLPNPLQFCRKEAVDSRRAMRGLLRAVGAFFATLTDRSPYEQVSLGLEFTFVITYNGPLAYRWDRWPRTEVLPPETGSRTSQLNVRMQGNRI
jgi:hypothetical protein